jgi:hypothetical protein
MKSYDGFKKDSFPGSAAANDKICLPCFKGDGNIIDDMVIVKRLIEMLDSYHESRS